jgi:hypothetical protein
MIMGACKAATQDKIRLRKIKAVYDIFINQSGNFSINLCLPWKPILAHGNHYYLM